MSLYLIDLDGTLIDSLWLWNKLPHLYLQKKEVQAPIDLDQTIKTMTTLQACQYFKDYYQWQDDIEEIYQEIADIIGYYYREVFQLKRNARAYLKKLKSQGHTLVLFTITIGAFVDQVLERLQIRDCFDEIVLVEEEGYSKTQVELYEKLCRRFAYAPENTILIEDSLHAIEAGKKAGLKIVAMLDPLHQDDLDNLKALADEILDNQFP